MKKMYFTRAAAAVLSAIALLSATPMVRGAEKYNDSFRDVSKNDWFYESVAEAYSLGIINGISATEYAPNDTLDLASCIKLACCIHQLKNDGAITLKNGIGNWYDPYITYAMKHNIITEAYADYNAPASRAQIAVIFSRVLSADEARINAEAVEKMPFPDVADRGLWYYSSVYKMYAWGIMTGDDKGLFNPEGKIKRSEIAAVAVRMLNRDRRVTVSLSDDANPPAEENPPAGTDEPAGTNAPLHLHAGGTDAVPFTGLTGFSLVYHEGEVTGYSTDCINDVVLTTDALTFRLKKSVGFTAMGIVRGWLNNAASTVDGLPTARTEETVKEALKSRFALYVNGRKAEIDTLEITTDDGDFVYTFHLAKACSTDKVTDAVLVCGELPDIYSEEAKATVEAAQEAAVNPFDGEDTPATEPVLPSDDPEYRDALEAIANEGAEILFEHETARLKVFYTLRKGYYSLRFVYRDGSVQEIASGKLNDIRVNDAGTVLYYTLLTPDGDPMEFGISIGNPPKETEEPEETETPEETESPKDSTDLKGVLSGLNITLSAKDKTLIALMEGEGSVLFRGVYSNRETAFSIMTIAPSTYFSEYPKYLNREHNRIFALKDGIYYVVIYADNVDERTREAAERVIDSVVAENAFDVVYTLTDQAPQKEGGTYLYLKNTYASTIVGDPFLLVEDATAAGGYRIDNSQQESTSYQITANTVVWVLAMDYAPRLRTTYGQFYKNWPLGSKWNVWRTVIDPSTNTVTALIQETLP